MTDPFGECECAAQYTIEPHGSGYALYYGRCTHRHGYNLINMVEPAWNFEPKHLANMLNLGQEVYKHVDGVFAEDLVNVIDGQVG